MAFPQTAAPALSNWQAQYNGLTLGASTAYDIGRIEGLDMPSVRTGDINRPREFGEFVGLDDFGGRDVTLTGDFVNDGTSLQHASQALAAAFPIGASTEQPFWIQLPNLPCLGTMVRTRKRNMPVDLAWSVSAMASMAVQMHSTDPRLYTTPSTGTCGVGGALGGFVFNATPPFIFSSGSVAGTVVAVNTGNIEMRPILTITGPVTNPVVYNATTGWLLQFTNPSQTGYTLNAGDTLVIDTDTHGIQFYAGGVGAPATRRNWLIAGSVWPSYQSGIPGLAPGSNIIQFTSSDTSAVAGTLAVNWASAYML